MRISDWSSDVCSSDLAGEGMQLLVAAGALGVGGDHGDRPPAHDRAGRQLGGGHRLAGPGHRSEERRVGKECVSKRRARGSRYTSKKKRQNTKWMTMSIERRQMENNRSDQNTHI